MDVVIGDKQLSIPKIQFVETLPSGANSIVYKGFDTLLDRVVVVKFWVKTRENDTRDKILQASKEAKKLAKLEHQNIVKVYYGDIQHDVFFIVMEYVPGVTLKEYLVNNNDLRCRKLLWKNIFDAVTYSHSKDVYHGDLHDRNVLVSGDEAKIIDFGTSLFAPTRSTARRRESDCLTSIFKRLFSDIVTPIIPDTSSLKETPEILIYVYDTLLALSKEFEDLQHLLKEKEKVDITTYSIQSSISSIAYHLSMTPFFDIQEVVDKLQELEPNENFVLSFLIYYIQTLELRHERNRRISAFKHIDGYAASDYFPIVKDLEEKARAEMRTRLSNGYDDLMTYF